MKFTYTFVLTILIFFSCHSQKWKTMMSEPGHNFYDIQKEFNEYWKDKDITQKGCGYKPFKRWENFAEQRVYPSGDLSLLSTNMQNYLDFKNKNRSSSKMLASSTWTAIGPFGALSGLNSSNSPQKAGRLNFVTFDPTNPNVYWVGAASGGLWQTTNNGTSWNTNTDYLSVIGCSDLAIDPLNAGTMYLATGDGVQGHTESIGVLKSTDGGLTWNPTGLVFTVSQQRKMRRLLINPTNPQILIAATNVGIYRTLNGGVSWTQVTTSNTFDLEFKPGDPNTVYAAGTTFLRSVNGGASFVQISAGIPTSGSEKMNIAVTPADSNYVYVLSSLLSTSALQGVYRSVNGGTTFTLQASTPNLLGNLCAGTSTVGQGWYDLALTASPLNKDEIAVGGVNVWRSINGGSTYVNIGCWNNTGSLYVHADQQELEYTSAGELFSANDGGIFSWTGTSWTDKSNPMNIAQIYKIGLSSLSPNLWISGHQDNGTSIYNGTTYNARLGGDGMDAFFDRTNNNNVFASQQNGALKRSVNGGSSWLSATNGLPNPGPWVTPWKQDPWDDNRIYAGFTQMYVSNNKAVNWTLLGAIGGGGNIIEFAIAPSNNQVIYIIRGTSIRKTINGGTSWTHITGSLPVSAGAPSFITIDPTDANRVWVTMSGYSLGNKVFQTIDGGTTWTNISSNLPNLPANCSVYQVGSNGMLYVGMDVGVYYKDNTSTTWTLYNTNLPNVPIGDMEISPAAAGKLRAATFGRGVYEVDVINPLAGPVSSFSHVAFMCPKTSQVFTDNSNNSPTSWNWSVLPATGVIVSSSVAQNPSITFPAPGSYTVSLNTTNNNGPGSTAVHVVTVSPGPQLNINVRSRTICKGEPLDITLSGALSYTWLPGNSNDSTLGYIATLPIYSYTIESMGTDGCISSDTLRIFVSECTGISNTTYNKSIVKVYPNPTNGKVYLETFSEANKTEVIEITDVTGKVVMKINVSIKKGRDEIAVNISALANGNYMLTLTPASGKSENVRIIKE